MDVKKEIDIGYSTGFKDVFNQIDIKNPDPKERHLIINDFTVKKGYIYSIEYYDASVHPLGSVSLWTNRQGEEYKMIASISSLEKPIRIPTRGSIGVLREGDGLRAYVSFWGGDTGNMICSADIGVYMTEHEEGGAGGMNKQ